MSAPAVEGRPAAAIAPENTRESASLAVEQGVVELYRTVFDRIKSQARIFSPDLQPAGYGIMRYIKVREPIRAAEIATSLGIDKSAVSRQVATLREMGLIETTPDPDDGRASLLVLTEETRRAISGISDQTTADYGRVLDTWSDDDLFAFARLLRRFTAEL